MGPKTKYLVLDSAGLHDNEGTSSALRKNLVRFAGERGAPMRITQRKACMNNLEGVDVAHDVPLVLANIPPMGADLLRYAFSAHPWIKPLGTAANTEELAALITENHVQIVLVGSTAIRQESTALPFLECIAAFSPTARPIVMSEDMSREDVVTFFQNGARGLLCKATGDLSLLIKSVRCVSAGQIWANSEQLEILLRSLSSPRSLRVTNVVGDSLLSQREEQVLHLLVRGLSNRDIARTLKLSEHTVKNHLFRIFDKLGVSSRMEAVLFAIGNTKQKQRETQSQAPLDLATGVA